MSTRTYQEGNQRPMITDASLTEGDLSALRKLRSYEIGTVPACLTVVKDGIVWAFKSVVGNKPSKRPLGTGELISNAQPLNGAHGEVTILFQHKHLPGAGEPWSRLTKGGNPRGPGKIRLAKHR